MWFFIYTIDNSLIINFIVMSGKLFWKSLLLRYVLKKHVEKLKLFDATRNVEVFAKKDIKRVRNLLNDFLNGNLFDNHFGSSKELNEVVQSAYKNYVLFRETAMQNNDCFACKKAVFYALSWGLAKQIVARREMCDILLSSPSFCDKKALC